MVFSALTQASGPLSAYGILDLLREDGFRAPPQVYRALDKLVEAGLVHRLESLNAFVACRHKDRDDHPATAFAICDRCGTVVEITATDVQGLLASLAERASFVLAKSTIELRGLCSACAQ